MTMLVTLFLVLINIHNTIQTNSPKVMIVCVMFAIIRGFFQAEGFTAIKSWVIACIVFVFGAMLEYSVILLMLKLEKMNLGPQQPYNQVRAVKIPPLISALLPSLGAVKPLLKKTFLKTTLHPYRHDLLLHLSDPLPDLQPDLLVERGQLAHGDLEHLQPGGDTGL